MKIQRFANLSCNLTKVKTNIDQLTKILFTKFRVMKKFCQDCFFASLEIGFYLS